MDTLFLSHTLILTPIHTIWKPVDGVSLNNFTTRRGARALPFPFLRVLRPSLNATALEVSSQILTQGWNRELAPDRTRVITGALPADTRRRDVDPY